MGLGRHIEATTAREGWRRLSIAVLCLLGVSGVSGAVRAADGSAVDSEAIWSQEKRYSQFDEELIIRHFFADRRGGFFVDVGCSWPDRASTTYYLEKHLGWRGFGIDALPEYAPAWLKKRPGARFFQFAVSDRSDELVTFYRARHAPNSSTNENLAAVAGKMKAIEVPTITLTDLLDRNGVEKIDFLSMDIEGSEPKALEGFEIGRFAPQLVAIEMGYNREIIADYFARNGYERIDAYIARDMSNWYFKRASGPASGPEGAP